MTPSRIVWNYLESNAHGLCADECEAKVGISLRVGTTTLRELHRQGRVVSTAAALPGKPMRKRYFAPQHAPADKLLDPVQESILAAMRARGGILTFPEVLIAAGASLRRARSVRAALKRLWRDGYLQTHSARGVGGYYSLVGANATSDAELVTRRAAADAEVNNDVSVQPFRHVLVQAREAKPLKPRGPRWAFDLGRRP